MEKITVHPDGSRTIHRYRPLPPERRPQDPTLDGRTLPYETLEHGGEYPDYMPLTIRVSDAEGRHAVYVVRAEGGPDRRPQDPTLDGRTLRHAALEHDRRRMPMKVRVIDAKGRSAVDVPITEDGEVVDSEGYELVSAP
jgi:hypothetical protein